MRKLPGRVCRHFFLIWVVTIVFYQHMQLTRGKLVRLWKNNIQAVCKPFASWDNIENVRIAVISPLLSYRSIFYKSVPLSCVIPMFKEYCFRTYKLQIDQEQKHNNVQMPQSCEQMLAKINEDNEFTNNLWMQTWMAYSVISYGVIGPYSFENENSLAITITSARYVAMLEIFVVQKLDVSTEDWYQQDGSMSQTARISYGSCTQLLGNRLISRKGNI